MSGLRCGLLATTPPPGLSPRGSHPSLMGVCSWPESTLLPETTMLSREDLLHSLTPQEWGQMFPAPPSTHTNTGAWLRPLTHHWCGDRVAGPGWAPQNPSGERGFRPSTLSRSGQGPLPAAAVLRTSLQVPRPPGPARVTVQLCFLIFLLCPGDHLHRLPPDLSSELRGRPLPPAWFAPLGPGLSRLVSLSPSHQAL